MVLCEKNKFVFFAYIRFVIFDLGFFEHFVDDGGWPWKIRGRKEIRHGGKTGADINWKSEFQGWNPGTRKLFIHFFIIGKINNIII